MRSTTWQDTERTVNATRVFRACLLSVAALLATSRRTPAQERVPESTVEIISENLVHRDSQGFPLVEPHLAANPRDPAHLVVGVIVVTEPDLTGTTCAALTTFDGGHTWVRHDFELDGICGDPWVAFAPDGTVLLSVLLQGKLFLFRSSDGGRSWPDESMSFGSGHDHPTMVVAGRDDPEGGTVYLASTQTAERPETGRRLNSVFVARSTDNGLTFHAPERLFPLGLSFNTMTPVVLSDGILAVPFRIICG